MAEGSLNPKGTNPWAASPKTGGPLGTNMDAADPDTPGWFLGNTPGPLGHHDQADPVFRRLVPMQKPDFSSEPPPQPTWKSQCDSDWRYGVTARMMLNGVWLSMDKQAWEIFDLWFNGKAPAEVTFDSEEWSSYMQASEGLTRQINDHLTQHAAGIRARVPQPLGFLQETLGMTFHAEVGTKYGGYTSGYEVLHGSNKSVGDFQVTGTLTAVCTEGDACTVTYENLEFVFNDVVDINKQYKTDIRLGQVAGRMAQCLDTGPPKDYVLRIKWAAPKPVIIELQPVLPSSTTVPKSTAAGK